jgi:hypothetical protein
VCACSSDVRGPCYEVAREALCGLDPHPPTPHVRLGARGCGPTEWRVLKCLSVALLATLPHHAPAHNPFTTLLPSCYWEITTLCSA